MTRKFRTRNARSALCLTALAGVVFSAPGAALAGHEQQERYEDRHQPGVHRQIPVYWHGEYCNRNVRALRNSYRRQQIVYTCQPCSRRFDTPRAFQTHLRHQHHIAFWAMPFAIVHHALGWIFYG